MKTTKTLGLDLGVQSLGWALVEEGQLDGSACIRVSAIGSHVFEAGMEGDMASGKEESRNATRRAKRLLRRQYDRRRRRMAKIRRLLQQAGLLPEAKDMAQELLRLDAKALAWLSQTHEICKQTLAHVVPYALRAKALDTELEPHLLGRALYQLAQRRGFLSNRKEAPRPGKEEEAGVVKEGIQSLEGNMQQAGARTLGEYFAGLNPEESRIRERYTHRNMFLQEFDAIWKAQKKYHPAILTDEFYAKLHRAFFFQRKLKSVRHLVAECPYEKGAHRCPWYEPEAQQFRILQAVNHLQVIPAEGEARPLTAEERTRLIDKLGQSASLSFKEAKKLLGFKAKAITFNLEEGGEKRFLGHTTQASLLDLFGNAWRTWERRTQEKIIHDLVSVEKEDILLKRGEAYGLSGPLLDKFCDLRLEPDYCSLSKRAIRRLLPLMEQGIPYMTAVKQVYPNRNQPKEPADVLPCVDRAATLRNPTVHRCLTEVRQCVNAIIKRYGKPDRIHIELARDIKATKKERKNRTDKMREQEERRAKAKETLLKKWGIQQPSREDILKVLLWEECRHVSPYTGKAIGWHDLLGMDIEHIIPYSRSLDDSYVNKTLCEPDFNRKDKRNRTPYEMAHGTPQYEQIIGRVQQWAFQNPATREKLRRFQLSDLSEFEDFTKRHLNDTRYASREAMEYLGLLYGGSIDAEGRQRIFAVSGGITAKIRNAFKLNGLLGGLKKNREDHRHHAVDALVIALTRSNAIEAISKAAERSFDSRILFDLDQMAGEGFLDHIREKVDAITVTHHLGKKARGALHKETLYGPRGPKCFSQRVRVEDLSPKDLTPERIPTQGVLQGIELKLRELGETEPKKAFKAGNNLPHVLNANGQPGNVIRKVRLQISSNAFPVGKEPHVRYVQMDSIHHVEIVAHLDENGKETKWEGHVVPMLEAYQRKRRKEPVVQRDHGPGKIFKFSMAGGDVFEMEYEPNRRECFIIRVLSQQGQFFFVRLADARKKKDIISAKAWFSKYYANFRELKPEKVWFTRLGEKRRAHD
jgi:CRISPR-associated endonuclease Csn1